MTLDVLLDLDGTLVDPRDGITGCVQYALRGMGREAPPLADLAWCVGPPLRKSFARFFDDDADIERALDLYRERFSGAGVAEAAPYPETAPALDMLRAAGHRLFVATSKPEVYARVILDRLDLTPRFVAVAGASLDTSRDTKAAVIGHLLDTAGVDPARAVMVGDRAQDAVGARAHGIPCIGVLHGYGSAEELTEAGVVGLCADMAALPEALAGLRR